MKDRYYWELVVIVRKMLMISIIVFFAYSVNIQALMAVLLVVVGMCYRLVVAVIFLYGLVALVYVDCLRSHRGSSDLPAI